MGAQLFNGVNGVPRGTQNIDLKDVMPRVGFAYKLGPEHRHPRRRRAVRAGVLHHAGIERVQPLDQPDHHQGQQPHVLRHAGQSVSRRHAGAHGRFAGAADQSRPGRYLEQSRSGPLPLVGVQLAPPAPDQELAARARLHAQQDVRHLVGPEPEPAELRPVEEVSLPRENFDPPAARWTRCYGIRWCRIRSRVFRT